MSFPTRPRSVLPVHSSRLALAFGLGLALPLPAPAQEAPAGDRPLKALLIAGGCCHDYAGQHVALFKGIQARANVQVDVAWSDDTSTNPPLPIYDSPDWAKGYDVIIHDECAADNKDVAVMKRILDVHQTIPAVHLHCAMHSFRNGTDQWFKHLGLASNSHGPQVPIAITFQDRDHPITKTLKDWTTGNEELYNNVNLLGAHPLALGTQTFEQDGKASDTTFVVAWTNEQAGARSFSTTIGHNTSTVEDPRYLELVTRGLLWSCDKLNDAHLKPFTGQNKVTLMKAAPAPQAALDPARYAKEGNIPPSIVKLTPEEEAAILQDVTVPDGFDRTIFSSWQAANYPVYVAAAPNGDLYVSSDGNGSLGRNPQRGRVLRLRDTDQDGRADQVTEFIKHIDSPRGLIWDHDRLYLLHPPDLSVHFDRDGDGVAEESKTLLTGIAFGFDQRPPDHTTNGLELGIDGWIYIAGGDFGFMEATGTDGRKLQHRAGGVIRFRPDGSGLQIFATGTRNILGTPMSPLLDLFARDNTNDGGGWNVRFHHFSGLEDHGYPRLYINFADETVAPLKDYGGGSGCGSVYIHEPGFPTEWKHAPFTCDWGTGALWRHSVQRNGATFAETSAPQKFIGVTRPTDADVDALSRVYVASWKGPATFDWAGPEHGYIVRVSPTGYTPDPLPDFEMLSDLELVALLESPSHLRTLTAQRTLLRRMLPAGTRQALVGLAADSAKPLEARVAALYALTQRGVQSSASAEVIAAVSPLANDPSLEPFVLRALGDLGLDLRTAGQPGPTPASLLIAGMASRNPRTRLEAAAAAAWQGTEAAAPAVATLLGDPDPVVAHTAFQALARLGSAPAAFAVLDSTGSTVDQRRGAALALMRIHDPLVVDGLIARLAAEERPDARRDLLAALCRLHSRDAQWTGDNWGTRPDTRGPYYQPAAWDESPKVLRALQDVLAKASPAEAAWLLTEMTRNRIESSAGIDRIIVLAGSDPSLLPEAISQLAAREEVPAHGIALARRAATQPGTPPATLAGIVSILARGDDREALPAILGALTTLEKSEGAGKELEAGRKAFLSAPKLENRHLELEDVFNAQPLSPAGIWAAAAMLELATRKDGSPESRQLTQRAIDSAWPRRDHRLALIRAATSSRNHHLDDRIRFALADPDPGIAEAAGEAARDLKLQAPGEDKTPKIATLAPEAALAAVVSAPGDRTLGEAVFARATCAACHTVTQTGEQKGPYLGNIAATYPRPDLAAAILDPNRTIAQGFATNVITLKDGTAQAGFVTVEAGEHVTIRDLTAKEHTFRKSDISKRDTIPTSMMPPGLMNAFSVHETASLLTYLESLALQK